MVGGLLEAGPDARGGLGVGLTLAKAFSRPIATQIDKAPKFWRAEEYHQKYYQLRKKKPYCHLVPFAEEK